MLITPPITIVSIANNNSKLHSCPLLVFIISVIISSCLKKKWCYEAESLHRHSKWFILCGLVNLGKKGGFWGLSNFSYIFYIKAKVRISDMSIFLKLRNFETFHRLSSPYYLVYAIYFLNFKSCFKPKLWGKGVFSSVGLQHKSLNTNTNF